MSILDDYELFRDGIGLLPRRGTKPEGSAIWVRSPDGAPLRSCTCSECKSNGRRRKTCDSLRALAEGIRAYQDGFPDGWQGFYERTVWYQLAKAVYDGSQLSCSAVRVQQVGPDGAVRFLDAKGDEVLKLLDSTPSGMAFLERAGKVPRGELYINRAEVIDRLRLFQLTDQERAFEQAGMPKSATSLG